MSLGTFLQIAGAACELFGIGTVAWRIADTRAKFTDRLARPDGTCTRLVR